MKKVSPIFLFLFIVSFSFGQSVENEKHSVLRFNFVNPGIEYEHSISERSKLSTNIGYGVSLSYPNLTIVQPDHAFFLSPFVDIHYKNIYNFNKRNAISKNVKYNAGDFLGLKFNGRGNSGNSGLRRTDNLDFSIGPTWGMQRNYSNINLLFNLGPVYYFDTKGNSGFYPIILEFNIGYNIWTEK